jgi:hypothetical protein
MGTDQRPGFNVQQYNVLACPPKAAAEENQRKNRDASSAVHARDCRSGVIFL